MIVEVSASYEKVLAKNPAYNYQLPKYQKASTFWIQIIASAGWLPEQAEGEPPCLLQLPVQCTVGSGAVAAASQTDRQLLVTEEAAGLMTDYFTVQSVSFLMPSNKWLSV